jgi:hypothetical protein
MSIKQRLREPKRRKGKEPPLSFLLIQMKCLLLEKRAQMVVQDVFMFIEFSTPSIKRDVKDEV